MSQQSVKLYLMTPSTIKFTKENIFQMVVEGINLNQPLQKGKIKLFLKKQNLEFFEKANKYLNALYTVANKKLNYTPDKFVNSYVDFCKMILRESLYFKKHRSYRTEDQYKNLYYYDDKSYMYSYMCGLGISQFLWPNHHKMWSFFQKICVNLSKNIRNYLEVGPGHGFYLCEAINAFMRAEIKCIDLSKTSLEITKNMCDLLIPNFKKLQTINGNFLEIKANKNDFDLIVICEVLEHLNDPISFLKHTHSLLSKNGYAIISTCANSACVDHVYLYKSVEHIKSHIKQGNFTIEEELALPVEDKDYTDSWYKKEVESNYIALISKSS